MSGKIKLGKESNADDLDDARINQIIARYSNISDVSDLPKLKDKKYTSSSPKKKRLTASRNGHKCKTSYAYPIKHDNYFYKFPTSSDSGGDGKYHPILINCHNLCDSSCSNDSDSYFSITSLDCSEDSKEDVVAPRSKPKVQFQEHHKNENQQTSFQTLPCKKAYAEKTTYCRPVRTPHDRRFICKVVEKNAKLQLLLAKYVIARQKEKEREKWNNYVNMIKFKNRCFRDSSKRFSSPSVFRNGDQMISNHTTKNSLHQSDSCREMLQALYDTRDELYPEYIPEHYERERFNIITSRKKRNSQLHCFPNTSRVKRSYRDASKTDRAWPYHRSLYSPKIVCDDEKNITSTKGIMTEQTLKPFNSSESYTITKDCPRQEDMLDIKKSRDVQTHITFGGYHRDLNYLESDHELEVKCKDMKEEKNIIIENEKEIMPEENDLELIEVTKINNPVIPIQDLENKLDKIVDIFNSIKSKLKSKEILNESIDNIIDTDVAENQNIVKIDIPTSAKTKKKVTIVGNVMTNTSLCTLESHLTPSHYLLNMRLNKILYEELDKSNKIRSEIEAILNPAINRPCTVQTSFDIPTKERSTEVTASLSKTKAKQSGITIEEIIPDIRAPQKSRAPQRLDRRVAANTEPLGLLTLLRLSTEAVKQILSFVPNLSWYLTRGARSVPGSEDYVCNICGAAFARPSQLGAHILRHDLGQTRDCSVCRHTVDNCRPSQLFHCPHCGQRFTRAYCCELHRRSCSRRLRNYDPGLALLR